MTLVSRWSPSPPPSRGRQHVSRARRCLALFQRTRSSTASTADRAPDASHPRRRAAGLAGRRRFQLAVLRRARLRVAGSRPRLAAAAARWRWPPTVGVIGLHYSVLLRATATATVTFLDRTRVVGRQGAAVLHELCAPRVHRAILIAVLAGFSSWVLRHCRSPLSRARLERTRARSTSGRSAPSDPRPTSRRSVGARRVRAAEARQERAARTRLQPSRSRGCSLERIISACGPRAQAQNSRKA